MEKNMDPEGNISEMLLRAAVGKAVSEKLGTLAHEMSVFTNGWSELGVMAARLMVLKMIKEAANDFCDKMETRIKR